MPYCFKITRETNSPRVTVWEIMPAPRGTKPYKKRTTSRTESRRVFDTRNEATRARSAELLAADYSARSAEELRGILRQDLDRVANFGFGIYDTARVCAMSENIIRAYAYGKSVPNPRKVAIIHIFADLFENVANLVKGLLPSDEGCGNYMKARKGNPNFHEFSPNWKAGQRGKSQNGPSGT